MRHFKVENWFKGRHVVILGGGPSLTAKGFHVIAKARLALNSNIRVIAVNDAIFLAWWADWLHACDFKWWDWHKNRLSNYRGIKTTLDEIVPEPWAGLLNNTGTQGFDEDPHNCRTGGNGVYQAMHCAIHAGANRITIVGCDMNTDGHWHTEHTNQVVCNRPVSMMPHFKTLVEPLSERSIFVTNASVDSCLTLWPRKPIEEIFPDV